MERGIFEEHEGEGGRRVFRLRWFDEVDLSVEETRRGEFVRYLIDRGKLSEWPDQPPTNCGRILAG